MTKKVRIGIVGAGRWAEHMYLPSLDVHPEVEIAAICGRHRERAEAFAKRHGIARVFTDYRRLIEHGNLHALLIATPDDLHYPVVMHALDAGLHVLCEKPLANSADEARAMLAKAEAAGVKHMILFIGRWAPHFQHMKRLLADGYIGRAFQARLSFLAGFGRRGEYLWRFDRQRANGAVADLGSHMIDLARWYLGDVAKVSAHLATFVDRPGADGRPPDPANDSALLTLEFAQGAHATIEVSAVANTGDRWAEQHLALHGAHGTLCVDVVLGGVERGVVIRGVRHPEVRFQTLPMPQDPADEVECPPVRAALLPGLSLEPSIAPRAFIDAIVQDRQPFPDFHDGLKVQEVVEAALISHRTGCQVSLR
jgi:predicted dehydrogenase